MEKEEQGEEEEEEGCCSEPFMFLLIWLIWEEDKSNQTNAVELTRVDRRFQTVSVDV